MATFRTFFWLIALLCLSNACTEKRNNNEGVAKYLDKSLENSKKLINRSTENLLSELEEKTKDPATAVRGKVWFAKAIAIRDISNEMCRQMEDFKKKLFTGSINKNIALRSVAGMDEELKKVVDKLMNYNRNLLAIDSGLNRAFSNYVSFDDDKGSSGLIFYPINLFSTIITVSEAIYLLNQFENNIKITENRMVQFANNKCSSRILVFDSYSVIIGINSMQAGPGTRLEIEAGVGAFCKKCNPEIIIGGKLFSISEDGTAHYDFNASQKPGKYYIPVKITYTNELGNRNTIEKNVEYSVVK
jgi:hypothetical protein